MEGCLTIPNVPNDISAYSRITAILDPAIQAVLAGRDLRPRNESDYDPSKPCPDFERTLADKCAKPIPTALHKNLRAISHDVITQAATAMKTVLGNSWEYSGGFWYPAVNGFMDWHTNHTTPGARIYLVWCKEGGKARFLYSPDGGKTMAVIYEPAGWSINAFMLTDVQNPFWHAVDSGGTDRISFGFKPRSNASILMQESLLLQGSGPKSA
jgi:hypothetical protein